MNILKGIPIIKWSISIILISIAPFVYALDETWNGNASFYNATSQLQYIEYLAPFDDSGDKTSHQQDAQDKYSDCDDDGTKSELEITQSRDTTGERTVEANGKTFTVLYPNEVAKLSARIVCSSRKQSEGKLWFEYRVYDDYANESTLHSTYHLYGHFKTRQNSANNTKYNFDYEGIEVDNKDGLSRTVKDNLDSEKNNIIPVSSMIMTIKNESNTDYYIPMKNPNAVEVALMGGNLNQLNPVLSNVFDLTSIDANNVAMEGCMANVKAIKVNRDNIILLPSLVSYFYRLTSANSIQEFLFQYSCNPTAKDSEIKTKPMLKLLNFSAIEYGSQGGFYEKFSPDFEIYAELTAKCKVYDCQAVSLDYDTGSNKVGESGNKVSKDDKNILLIK